MCQAFQDEQNAFRELRNVSRRPRTKRTSVRSATRVRRVLPDAPVGSAVSVAANDNSIVEVRMPARKTLDKYGLSEPDWLALCARARGVCEICQGKTKRLVIDHEHVKGWKHMPPEMRRRYVRGLLCWRDNVSVVGRGVTVTRLANAVAYLTRYQQEGAL